MHINGSVIKSIPVLQTIKLKKAIHIKMPYIDGLNGSSIALFTTSSFYKEYSKFIDKYFSNIFFKITMAKIKFDTFDEKIVHVYKHTKFELSVTYNDLIHRLKSYHSGVSLPMGSCHGDFTFDNLIITETNVYYLFDFLKTFLETPIQDYVKLMQDIDHDWCLRDLTAPEKSKGRIFMAKIKTLPILKKIERDYSKQIKLLELISIMRIAPYIRDELTREWFEINFMKILGRIK